MQKITALDIASSFIRDKEAQSLISEVFEVWETFNDVRQLEDIQKPVCPGCGGDDPEGTSGDDRKHEVWCWFHRATKWLKGIGLEPPACT